MKHLAIFKGRGAEKILSGQKSIESRFAKGRIAPYKVVSRGDLVYIKASGGDIIGQFRVKKVIFFDGLELLDFRDIRKQYGIGLNLDQGYWKGKESCKYGTLIFIGDSSRFITSPVKIPKKDLRGWVVLDSPT